MTPFFSEQLVYMYIWYLSTHFLQKHSDTCNPAFPHTQECLLTMQLSIAMSRYTHGLLHRAIYHQPSLVHKLTPPLFLITDKSSTLMISMFACICVYILMNLFLSVRVCVRVCVSFLWLIEYNCDCFLVPWIYSPQIWSIPRSWSNRGNWNLMFGGSLSRIYNVIIIMW